jgi:hypothetical protein
MPRRMEETKSNWGRFQIMRSARRPVSRRWRISRRRGSAAGFDDLRLLPAKICYHFIKNYCPIFGAMKNAVNIYLPPGRHPVISAIAPELESRFAHILTEPFPENITALLQRLDARLSAEPANLPCDRRDHPHQAAIADSKAAWERKPSGYRIALSALRTSSPIPD